jgi:hypothetical protein
VSTHANSHTHCDTSTYSHVYANHDADGDRNSNRDCYAHSYTPANPYTTSFSDAAAAADACAKTVIPRVISGR